ncbi:TIR domain-containing protein [Frankia sp. AiPa1]|uniref:TIR domain-containing protein n=1 Tax=Frankia sp. AiPa1 TaxID=573492 RepID=UPI00202ADFB4|nr:TIR domain-containing protein [Frankia sp. AiPa1]MCL9762217.1 toll/interleukin-1 receptor domain-containing protein [Frankia sp. AiPa1]
MDQEHSTAAQQGASRDFGRPEDATLNFFISYTTSDRPWAEWIAWQLEEKGFRVFIQDWDSIPGRNWMFGMQRGATEAEHTIALLSDDYLDSVYGQAEWQAAQAADPAGFRSKLVPIRVMDCPRPGLLGQIVSFDLFGLSEPTAKLRLIEQIKAVRIGRAKPTSAPPFPARNIIAPGHEPRFPGESDTPFTPTTRSHHAMAMSTEARYSQPSNLTHHPISPDQNYSVESGDSQQQSAATIHSTRNTERIKKHPEKSRLNAALMVSSYFPVLGWFTLRRRNKEVRFHAIQAIEIDILFCVFTAIGTIADVHSEEALSLTFGIIVFTVGIGFRLWLLMLIWMHQNPRLYLLGTLARNLASKLS